MLVNYLILLFIVLIFIGNFKPDRTILGAFPVAWTEALQSVRKWLDDINAQISDPQNFSRQTGMLNYLFSGLNPPSIETIQRESSNMSLYRPIDIRYIPHEGTGNLITNDANGNCTRVAQRRDSLQQVQPNLYVEHKFTIDEDYVRENAENGMNLSKRLGKQLQSSMRIIRENMNSQLLAKQAGLFGSNPAQGVGAGNYTPVTMTIASSGKIDDNNWDQITNDQEDNFQGGEIGIIGKGNARKYMNRLAVGGLNDAGINYIDVAREFGIALFKDDDAASVLSGANNALVIYPGNTQFFQYNLFKGDFIQDFGDRIKGTIEDPFFPITYDYILEYDKNCTTGNGLQGAWIGRVLTYFDIWNMPEAAFGDVYSSINDFNGVLGYTFNES